MADTTGSAIAREFTLPEASQVQSSLLQLPPELKIKILRNLMKASEAIKPISVFDPSWSSTEVVADYVAQAQFSSQLLSCCQQLLDAGTQILYRENVLEIQSKRTRLSTLDGQINIPPHPRFMKIDIRDIDSWMVDAKSDPLDTGRRMKRLLSFEKNLVAMKSFQALHICSDVSSLDDQAYETFFVLCRALSGPVDGKDVSLRVVVNGQHDVVAMLKSCRIWTCKSLTYEIQIYGQTPWTKIDNEQVSSSRGVKDTMMLLKDIWQLIDKLPWKIFSDEWADLSSLNLAVFTYDYDSAEQAAIKYLEDLNEDASGERSEIQLAVDHATREIPDCQAVLRQAEVELEKAEQAVKDAEQKLAFENNIKSNGLDFLNGIDDYQEAHEALRAKLMRPKRN